jgi:hypothetical protein
MAFCFGIQAESTLDPEVRKMMGLDIFNQPIPSVESGSGSGSGSEFIVEAELARKLHTMLNHAKIQTLKQISRIAKIPLKELYERYLQKKSNLIIAESIIVPPIIKESFEESPTRSITMAKNHHMAKRLLHNYDFSRECQARGRYTFCKFKARPPPEGSLEEQVVSSGFHLCTRCRRSYESYKRGIPGIQQTWRGFIFEPFTEEISPEMYQKTRERLHGETLICMDKVRRRFHWECLKWMFSLYHPEHGCVYYHTDTGFATKLPISKWDVETPGWCPLMNGTPEEERLDIREWLGERGWKETPEESDELQEEEPNKLQEEEHKELQEEEHEEEPDELQEEEHKELQEEEHEEEHEEEQEEEQEEE